jgi:hypothetical protein
MVASTTQLHAAQAADELPDGLDVGAAADIPLVLYGGMLALARTGRTLKVDFDRELELATGLKAPSIYKAFDSKAGLFDATLDRYRRDVVDRRVSEHLLLERGLGGILSFFTWTYSIEPLPTHGCLLTNSAIEFSMIDQRAQRKVTRGPRGADEPAPRECMHVATSPIPTATPGRFKKSRAAAEAVGRMGEHG